MRLIEPPSGDESSGSGELEVVLLASAPWRVAFSPGVQLATVQQTLLDSLADAFNLDWRMLGNQLPATA